MKLSRRRALQAPLLTTPWALWPAPGQATASARVAVVIGNAAYPGSPLLNPTRDARAMAALLREMGFEVVEAHDAGRAQMQQALQQAQARLAGRQGVGLLYYAGHGLQLDWRNYMLPLDARPQGAADVPAQAVDVQAALDAFQAAGTRMHILVLDACRDNPFGSSASARGLAPMDAPPGTFFAYATAPGHVAEDGSAADGHGLYTRHLLNSLREPGARIEDVFKRVRLRVRQASQGRQIPWESTSLEDDFIFATGQRAARDEGALRDEAFERELAEWQRIRDSDRVDDLYAFLQRHPNGRISELAQFRLDQLARPALQAQLPAALRVLPPGTNRFALGDSWAIERTDHLAGDRKVQLRSEVTSLDGSRVLMNHGAQVFDQMGGVLVNRFGTKTPAVIGAPAGLQVGKRWRSAFSNQRPGGKPSRSFYEHRVTALEELEVPAGRFRVFRIEADGQGEIEGQVRQLHTSLWIDPATMTMVKQLFRHTRPGSDQLAEHSTDVLLWRRLVPRA